MDMTETIVPRSDQLNSDDLMTGPRTVTIEKVSAGSAEQPVDVHLVETDRPYRPSKSMRRVMVAAWGPDTSAYTGMRMTIYRDPEITFGPDAVGGIRISHMSGIKGKLKIALTVKRGSRKPFIVEPLTEAASKPAAVTQAQLSTITGLLTDLDMSDRDVILGYVGTVVGHPVASSKALTESEASAVIESLTADQAAASEPTLDGA